MLTGLHRAPFAVACWMGLASGASRGGRILVGHGTPRDGAAALERQLAYLKRRFRVVPLAEMVACAGDADGMVALTFDDGLRSNFAVACPILQRLRLPATFFVCPGLIDEGRWIWTHEARWRLRALSRDAEAEVERMKALAPVERAATLQALRRSTPGLLASTADREAWDLAGWEELRRLDPSLFTVGSHSMTHPMLTATDPVALQTEVAGSRRLLEERLQRPAQFFCYPNGDADDTVLACVRRHYRAAVGDEVREVLPDADPHLLPRLTLPRGALRLASRMNRAYA